MSDSILVRISLVTHDDRVGQPEQVMVQVQIPDVARAGWRLPVRLHASLLVQPWEDVLRDVFLYADRRLSEPDVQLRASRELVRGWLAEPENKAAMHAAWAADRILRDPITRGLHEQVIERDAENGRLRGELAETKQRSERRRIAWRMARQRAIAVGGAADRYAVRARSAQDALQDMLFTVFAGQLALKASVDERNQLRARVAELEAAGVFVPQTERERWVAIADALNATVTAGMAIGIDLDGTLTDHRMWSVVWDRAAGRWMVAGYEDEADGITQRIAPTQALQPGPDAPVLVYRAQWDSMALGLYTTPDAARAHCEDHARRDLPGAAAIDWVTDEEDGVAELHATVDGAQGPTGYVVTPLELASEYDAEADE